ncbi:MAG: hypothetical protein E7225_07100 [Clostridiales bacterium]|nr:hypothetical protein [Clostridiales bacterium]
MKGKTRMAKHFIIGYIGSDRLGKGKELAEELGCPVLVMDDEIERLDGRKIFRLVMVNGEHAYRNAEFEMLSKLVDPAYDHGLAKDEDYPETMVVVCGDGIILDEMSLEILEKQTCVFVDEDPEVLWERVKDDSTIPYFFMASFNQEEKKKNFLDFHEIRRPVYMRAAGLDK